ncbi:MAG: PD-(D/E)XK nuclease family protein, partial [Muribaculaceae bacterium]|nr:PD-(D/E)XK nuclease family protein [Muribaculaceae bacterium]
LSQQGLRTVGGIYRDAADRVKLIDDHRLPRRVVMVGFSTLSVSEVAIFKALQQRGVADFWWDNALDVLRDDTNNPAGKMVREYAQLFPMPRSLEPETLEGTVVEAVAVPSVVGQAKWAFHRVDQWLEQGFIPHPDNAINTAIVLPDESLFVPLINSVSDKITSLNVTMGYSMRYANIVSLMHLVARAHRQATRRADEWTFYREDVKDILSHPIIKAAFTRQAMELSDQLAERNEWNIPTSTLCDKGFATLFTPLRDVKDVNQVLAYIDRLADFCNQVNESIKVTDQTLPPEEMENDDADIRKVLPLQSAFIDLYVEALDQLKLAFTVHGVPVADDTIFYLIDRLVQAMVVPFEGEPLKGLQVMGLQETRSLDFENLMILSMNERVFPRRHGIASFIPDTLRAAFYMLTGTRQEAIAAYDFYRLIGRASRVVLVYSTANEGGGEASRFISQLKLLYGDKVRFTDYRVDTKVTSPAEMPIVVDKAHVPMHDYLSPSASVDPVHAHCLSHSSIAEYIDCPLRFYLHHVEHLTDNSDKGDFMDYGTFGDIIHDALQQLYYPPMPGGAERKGSYTVTKQMIADFKRGRMREEVLRYIHIHYLHDEDVTAPLQGEALILQDTLETFVLRALDYDLKML